MDMNKRCIRPATRSDCNEINELRISEYSRADNNFTLTDSQKLMWSNEDDEAIVLSVWNENGRVLSTMRGREVASREELAYFQGCEIPDEMDMFPALALTRAATNNEYKNVGFHSTLRYCFIQYAFLHNYEALFGSLFANAPQLRSMERIGYRFIPTSLNNMSMSTGKTDENELYLAVLEANKFDSGLEILHDLVSQVLVEYPCEGVGGPLK